MVIAIVADFILLNKPNEKVSIKQATIWSIAWIIIGLVFNIGIWFWYYKYGNIEQANIKGLEFFTAYVVEKSLSIDNLFVFLTIFSMLGISEHLQKKVILIGEGGKMVKQIGMLARQDIEKFIEQLGEKFNIREIAFDRWGAVQLVQNLEGMGFTVVDVEYRQACGLRQNRIGGDGDDERIIGVQHGLAVFGTPDFQLG